MAFSFSSSLKKLVFFYCSQCAGKAYYMLDCFRSFVDSAQTQFNKGAVCFAFKINTAHSLMIYRTNAAPDRRLDKMAQKQHHGSDYYVNEEGRRRKEKKSQRKVSHFKINGVCMFLFVSHAGPFLPAQLTNLLNNVLLQSNGFF